MSLQNTVHEINEVRWVDANDVVQLKQLAYRHIVDAAAPAIAQCC